MNIRLLTPEDVIAYRELRLKSLAEEPDAFGTSYEEYSVRRVEQISDGLKATNKQWVLGAFTENNELIGIVGWTRKSSVKTRHKSEVWGVYVVPEQRGKGIASQFTSAINTKSEGTGRSRTDAIGGPFKICCLFSVSLLRI